MAAANGIRHEETLTGFKWISRVPGLAFGYEEALGYCVAPQIARDKDGVSAALLLAELAASLRARGQTVLDVLDSIAVDHGVYATDAFSVRVGDLAEIAPVMERLRSSPPHSSDGCRCRGSTTWPAVTAGCHRPTACAGSSPTTRG